jgi:putative ABC transport system permease protein
MDTLLQDLRYAARTLRGSPGFAAVAVVTLALGIGINTTVFSVVNTILLRPFPQLELDGMVRIKELHRQQGGDGGEASYENYRDYRRMTTAFSAVGAAHEGSMILTGRGGEPEQLPVEAVSANLFALLGAKPALGRVFLPEEETPGRHRVVVLTHKFWTERLNADPRIVGQTLTLDGTAHEVVGVMPERFGFPRSQPLWVPLQPPVGGGRGNHYLSVYGRLKEGATVEQAAAELAAVSRRLEAQYPETNGGWTASAADFRQEWSGEARPLLLVMLVAVAFVLLIACANVANLFLARATGRRREVAVRMAMGAGRGRLVRQLLTESSLVALMGGALGILLSFWGLELILAAFPTEPPLWMSFGVDANVLAFTVGVSLLTGMVFGLAPALHATRGSLHATLKDGARGATVGAGHARLRSALVVAELALAVVLLVGAMLMVRSFLALQGADPGFRTGDVLTLEVTTGGPRYEADAARTAFFGQVEDRVRQLPGVRSAALVNNVPLTGSSYQSGLNIEGRETAPGDATSAEVRHVSADYFSTLGFPVLRGRAMTAAEVAARAPVAVVGETLAERHWPGADPLGKRLSVGGAWLTVIGVARDVRQVRLQESPTPQLYLAWTDGAPRRMSLLVRTVGDPAQAAPAVRRAIREIDPTAPVSEIRAMEQVVHRSLWEQRLNGGMFTSFALIALLLACTGVYGTMAYSVSQRTHEIGVRMALGAHAGSVLRMVVGQGLSIAALGVGLGLAGAFAVTRALAGLLWGVSPTDPVSFLAVSALLGGVALLASYLPARRAARVDPMVALRSE